MNMTASSFGIPHSRLGAFRRIRIDQFCFRFLPGSAQASAASIGIAGAGVDVRLHPPFTSAFSRVRERLELGITGYSRLARKGQNDGPAEAVALPMPAKLQWMQGMRQAGTSYLKSACGGRIR